MISSGGAFPEDGRQQAGARERWLCYFGYGSGSFGACAALFPTGSLILYFLTDTIGLSVALATMAIAIPKIWDVLVDPGIGALIDRHSQRTGSRFTVFLVASFALPAAAASSFLIVWAPTVLAAVCITILLVAVSTAYTLYWVTHLAAADDLQRAGIAPRNQLLVARMVGQSAGGLFAGALAPLLLTLTTGFSRYALMAGTLSLIAVAAMLACAVLLKHARSQRAAAVATKLNFIAACRAAIGRPRALGLILSNFFVMMACTYVGTILPYLNKYVLGFDDSRLSVLFTSLMAAQIAGAMVGARLAKTMGLPVSFIAASAGMLLFGLFFYPATTALLWLSVALVGWGAATGAYTVLLHSSILEAGSGRDSLINNISGLLLGLLFATGKVGDTLGSLITASALTQSGGIAGLSSSPGAVHLLRLWGGAVPALLMGAAILSTLIADRAVRGRAIQPGDDDPAFSRGPS